MIAADVLKRHAPWARDLSDEELARACRSISEKTYPKGGYICHKGDRLDYWLGVLDGIVKLGTITATGKAVTFAGVRTGGWFGEGTLLKNEARQYDLVVLRESRLALMDRATFLWLFERSAGFNRYLVRQFNERLGQFIGLVEYDRSLDATARMARSIGWLFNPALYPDGGDHLDLSQEEAGLLSGISRQAANQALQTLESKGLIRLERGGITALRPERLLSYGEE